MALIQQPEENFQLSLKSLDLPQSHNSIRKRSASEPQPGSSSKSTVWTVIYGPDRLIYDRDRGRINYFSPATCYKNYLKDHMAVESWHLDKRSYRILADIPPDLESYLMDIFWNRYNNTLCVIDKQAFCRDQVNGGSMYYSGFLHLVCLAMAFRFADKDWPKMRQITLHDGCSILQREVKYILDRELETPRGLTTIQAMLVMSDMECTCGRDDLAAMHIAASCRLAFDFGLNLDCAGLGVSEAETKFRKDLLRSCMIYDRAWASYLGRPTNMKLCDISSACLPDRVSNGSNIDTSLSESTGDELLSSEHDLHGQILDALLGLMELSTGIQEVAQPRLTPGTIADENRLMDVAALDTKLKSWSSTLPRRLKWTPENVKKAPGLFFMMQ